jgi:para-nitrobenzyl esterase
MHTMNTTLCSLASTLALALALPLAAAIPQPVKTASGPVAGAASADGSVLAFKGIPYAAPPVGALRWRAPQPAGPWTAVRSADRFGASCMQNIVTERKPWTYEFMAHNEISEDCLYLNVWTPAKSAGEKLPVYFWIHGGGYVEGSGQVPVYDGANLARRGVVVVTINYRLGVFGYLAHPELTKEAGRSGNYGSLDQIAALQWVRKNIAAFGGDPRRVTIGGQSAGASSVHNLVASPLARGLFHRAIAESGSSYPTANASGRLAAAEQVGAAYGAAYGAASLQALRALPATALMTRPGNSPVSSFRPVIDGYFLPADPAEIYAQGKQNDVPELTGLNLDERSSEAEYGAARQAATREAGLVAMHLWAERRAAKSRHDAYTYYWTHAEPGTDSARYGAFHTSEVPYVFNTLDQSKRPWTDQDRKLAELLGAYWVNFMKNGDPNGAGLPLWPKFTAASATTMEIGDRIGPRTVADPNRLA